MSKPSEASSGLYRLLFHPAVYELVQRLVGADRTRRWFVNEVLRPYPGCKVLDIGCGTGELLPYLGDVDYVGVDNNPAYIEKASQRFGKAGRFVCASVDDLEVGRLGPFDRIMLVGVFHHVSDTSSLAVLATARGLLAEGGVLASADPCYFTGPVVVRSLGDFAGPRQKRSPSRRIRAPGGVGVRGGDPSLEIPPQLFAHHGLRAARGL